MQVISVQNVNDAVAKGIPYLLENGVAETSRNGTVLVAPGPVMTVYNKPTQRVLFSPLRDANPFFHLMESLWMLAGRNDIAFPAQFNKRMMEYSDDGETQWGAYGWRWREFFGYDQLEVIVEELKRNPNSRRCVLAMWTADYQDAWDRNSDLQVAVEGGKDVPCNTHVYFDMRGGRLNMTVCNRSNDAVWGAYGANAVHFSFLQEYMADQLATLPGVYRQFSNNFHAYTDVYDIPKLKAIAEEAQRLNLYNIYPAMVTPRLDSEEEGWMDQLNEFLESGTTEVNGGFLKQVAEPMYQAWFARKGGDLAEAMTILHKMPHCDWQVAAIDWIKRRKEGKANAA